MADRAGRFHERLEAGAAGEVQPVVEGLLGFGRSHLHDVPELFFELPRPKGPLVRLLEIPDHTLLGRAQVLPVAQQQPAKSLEFLALLWPRRCA